MARVPIFVRLQREFGLGICVSRYKLVNGTKLSWYDEFYYLHSGKAECTFIHGVFFITARRFD